MKSRLFIAAVSALLIGGAIVLKLFNPQIDPPALRTFVQTEYFHVPAHLLLYGALAAACYGVVGRRWWVVLLFVGAIGMVQEAAQSTLFGRAPGFGEAFDLFVDVSVALVVVVTAYVWSARKAR